MGWKMISAFGPGREKSSSGNKSVIIAQLASLIWLRCQNTHEAILLPCTPFKQLHAFIWKEVAF